MQPREKIIIAASGTPGDHGFQAYPQRDGVAPAGRQGANGSSACNPTNGSDGQDICVALSRSSNDEVVVVTGEKQWTGTKWEVPSDQVLLLDCKGGDGGDGGKGQDGQQGGQGSNGRNATKHRDAGDGGPGARGGDGGYGTNGASGGSAGNVLISVREEDMDLLLPVYWDIRGGKGGASGTHGDPGDGGIGGQGGAGCEWTERHGNNVYHKKKPPGVPGATGPPGSRPPTYLAGGSSGTNGSSQVKILRSDGTEATYPTRYNLSVVSFDIVDENQDGINEPGEHLFVKNIKVQNTGGMPSPTTAEIKVLIHGTHWLDPIESEPVWLPKDIPVGATVDVPGTLRAFIMQERLVRGPGQILCSSDNVQLIATAVRLGRTLPDFSGGTKIAIRYPLELDEPKYLHCVAQGDQVTFSWTLRNVSTKAYGIDGLLRRSGGTCLTDPGRVFEFVDASDGDHKMVDFLEELEPGAQVPISQTFKVSSLAFPYSQGHLKLELLLSEPSQNESLHAHLPSDHHEYPGMRSIVSYAIELQISGVYSFNPHSAYLLVVNSHMSNTVIHQIIKFVRDELRLNLDIFNLSVGGTFEDAGKNVLSNYTGKSIMVFANPFPYFGKGNKSAFDILDPWLVSQLAKAGTSFMFCGTEKGWETSVDKSWVGLMSFPTYPFEPRKPGLGSIHTQTFKELSSVLFKDEKAGLNGAFPVHSLASKKSIFHNQDSSLARDANKVAKKLGKCFPQHCFAVATDISTRGQESCGTVVIREGIHRSANVRATGIAFNSDDDEIASFNKFQMVQLLPFKTRAAMFWNTVGCASEVNGLARSKLYNGKGLEDLKFGGVSVSVQEQTQVSKTVCHYINLSVEETLVRELTRFTADAPWPDSVPREHSLKQLTLLNQFFDAESTASKRINSTEGTEALVRTLGAVFATGLSIGFTQGFVHLILGGAGSRKAGLKPQLQTKINKALAARFSTEAAATLEKAILVESQKMKRAVKAKGARLVMPMIADRVAETCGIANVTTLARDLANDTVLGTAPWNNGMAEAKMLSYKKVTANVRELEGAAKELLDEMVTKV